MGLSRSQSGLLVIAGSMSLVLLPIRPAPAAERASLNQPIVNFSAPYTRLLGAAPVKPPVLFADDTDGIAAKMEAVAYRYGYGGYPSFAMYPGYGGWYGPGYGYGAYGYYGAPYAGYWSSFYRPYGYLNFSPYGYASPYYAGYQPFGAYPFGGYYPPAVSMGVVAYPPYGLNNGGCCYW
jgi:hypothetical protein